jgi:hypothetical protein
MPFRATGRASVESSSPKPEATGTAATIADARLLSVDVDDLLIGNADLFGEVLAPSYRTEIEREVLGALDLLRECGVRATFFVNTQYCETHPDLLREIVAARHTLASHGHRHHNIAGLTLAQFEEDLDRSLDHITRVQPNVIGYRPPAFSMPFDDDHFRVLRKRGIRYVSSGVGVARSNAPVSQEPVEVYDGLVHVPISTSHYLGGRIKYPLGYGVTSRLMPERLYLATLRARLRQPRFFHWYCHPFELGGISEHFRVPYRAFSPRVLTQIYGLRCRDRRRYMGSVLRSAPFRSIESSLFGLDAGA